MTDFVLYIHGVNVRQPAYAKRMDRMVRRVLKKDVVTAAVYWGDVSDEAEHKLLAEWRSSPIWSDLWFPNLRERVLLQLIGDGALYISRAFGAQVVQRIYDVVTDAFRKRKPGDRLHLVAHSWGAVMVLDILFAARWEQHDIPGRVQVARLRESLFGLGKERSGGILLSSVTTMGSPMSLFSLMNGEIGSRAPSSHDIATTMRTYCRELYDERKLPLAWFNFVHPGDAFAYPTAPLLDTMLKDERRTVQAYDWLVKIGVFGKFVRRTIGRTDAAAALAPLAHNGYWDNSSVIRSVATSIRDTAKAAPHA